MTVSPRFYVIETISFGKKLWFDSRNGLWFVEVGLARHYATPERAVVDCDEFALCETVASEICVAPYKSVLGHNGQTVILPA